jgi:sugar phosphate isomerase/epimerase
VQEAGLPVVALHAPYRPGRDLSLLDEEQRAGAVQRAEEALALGRRLGAGLVVLHASEEPIPEEQRPQRRERARRSLEHLQEEARCLDLRLAVETMPPEWIPARLEEVLELMEGLDPEVVGCCLDTNHSNLNGKLDEFASALGRRLWHVHLSDNDGRQQRHWMPTRGVIDWGAFLEALDKIEYSGLLVYELDPHPDGPERGLREIEENFAQLKKLL